MGEWFRLAVIACVGLAGQSCSTDSEHAKVGGALVVDLEIADGIVFDVVSWEISGGEMNPMSGTIDTSAPGSTASIEVFGIPEGMAYVVELIATSSDGEVACGGSAPFDVDAGEVTEAHIMLRCKRAPRFGGVRVNGELNVCAELTKVVVSPLETSVGSDIDLVALVEDADEDPITTMWSASSGTFANPKAPTTSYSCTEAGEQQIRVVVSDDFEHCMSDWIVRVTCVPADFTCGASSDCDDGNPCTVDSCHVGTGSCIHDGAPNDGNGCGPGDGSPGPSPQDRGICSEGTCIPSNGCTVADDCPNTPMAPANAQCTAAVCDTTGFANVCSVSLDANEGVTCDQTTVGSGDGECNRMGVCGEAPCTSLSCPDLGPCVVSECDEESGRCEQIGLPDGTDCSAAQPPLASCQGGVCSANGCSHSADCYDQNDCTDDFCDIGTGICSSFPRTEGTRCSLPGAAFAVCTDGQCTESACTSDEQCDPETPCTEQGICDGATGACLDPVPNENGIACQRGDGTAGVCVNGFCGCASDSDCPGGSACRGNHECLVGSGLCRPGPPINEGEPCDYFGRGPESGRCEFTLCRPACIVNPCPDLGLECAAAFCSPFDGSCTAVNVPFGTPCTVDGFRGECGLGECILESCVGETRTISVACSNSVSLDQSILPFTLSVLDINDGAPLVAGAAFTAELAGTSVFPRFFLDSAQGVIPGGVSTVELVDIVATVQVRSGATGPDLPLEPDRGSVTPGELLTCDVPPGQICTTDEDCFDGFGSCSIPTVLVDLPTSTDCESGGACESLGETGAGSQCALNGFCVSGDLIVEVGPAIGSFTADPGPGNVLFGWTDRDVPGLVTCPAPAPDCQYPWMPDGCYDLPAAVFDNPTGPIGMRVNASGLLLPIQCAMATQGGICRSGEGCINSLGCETGSCTIAAGYVCPTPDANLIACPRL